MERHVTLTVDDGIATLLFDVPHGELNLISPEFLDELETVLEHLKTEANHLGGVVLLSGKSRNFIAGADISLIEELETSEEAQRLARRGQAVLARLAALPVPTVAAINGACLGGGLEIALACDYRICSDSAETVLGLPEVQLGIIPGFGGTQRLPRLVGIAQALKLITTGSRVFPAKARDIGLVDEVVAKENLVKASKRMIRRRGKDGTRQLPHRGPTGFRRLLESTGLGRTMLFGKIRQALRQIGRGNYPAPLAAVDAVEDGYVHGVDQGFETEARLLGDLAVTDVSRNLIRTFRLKESFGHIETGPAPDIHRIGVIGAGVMGRGIAGLLAEKGLWTRLINTSPKRLGDALRNLDATVDKKMRRRMYTKTQAQWVKARVTYDTVIRGLGGVQLVVEAVAERMEIKKSVLAEIARATRGDALLVSNTSSLSITEMQKGLPYPERFAGLHFFNPVESMPLVEIVRGAKTSPETVRRLKAFVKYLGKVPVVVPDYPGFLVNRILLPYLNEAARLLEDGVPVETIDKALLGFGMPLGAFLLLDTVGIDVVFDAARNLRAGGNTSESPSSVFEKMVDAKRLGRKVGRGFYRYNKGGKHQVDPDLQRFLDNPRTGAVSIGDKDIVNQLIVPMINEAARCIEQKVASSPETVDVAMILGAGFPPYTGGLLRYADSLGITRVVETLESLSDRKGNRFAPAGLLRSMAAGGTGFYTAKEERVEVLT